MRVDYVYQAPVPEGGDSVDTIYIIINWCFCLIFIYVSYQCILTFSSREVKDNETKSSA